MNCSFSSIFNKICCQCNRIRTMTPIDLTFGSDICPTEIIFIVFEKLDITSLRCCSLVNSRWKELVYHICEVKALWKQFAENGIANFAETHRNKSTLSWKELYFNSLLWSHIKSATITKIHEIDKLVVKSINVYKDNIIIVSSVNVEYYNVETFALIGHISVACDIVEETDDMIVVACKKNDYFRMTLFGKVDAGDSNILENVEKHFFGETYQDICEFRCAWRWKIHKDACYVIDFKYILWKAFRIDNRWDVKSVARYFGQNPAAIENSMSVMHVYEDNVYVSFKFGYLMRVERDSIQFRIVRRPEVPTHTITGPLIKRKPYKEGLDKFNVFIKAPFGVGFDAEFINAEMMHLYYEDPALSCGMQHGEVVFLGYDDGRVSIIFLKNYRVPVRVFNIKDYERRKLHDPAVTGLDVCEVRGSHVLLVKTNSKMYQLLIEYPNQPT